MEAPYEFIVILIWLTTCKAILKLFGEIEHSFAALILKQLLTSKNYDNAYVIKTKIFIFIGTRFTNNLLGQVMNGGFGMVLDGSAEAGDIAGSMLNWDVSNGVCRRAWAGHPLAQGAISHTQDTVPGYNITQCVVADEETLKQL